MGLSPVFIPVAADLGAAPCGEDQGQEKQGSRGPRLSRLTVLGHLRSLSSIPQGEGKEKKPLLTNAVQERKKKSLRE